MKFSERLTFNGYFLEVDACPPKDRKDGHNLSLSFNSYETFYEIVKRLARTQPDEQVKLAYAAIENEMATRFI